MSEETDTDVKRQVGPVTTATSAAAAAAYLICTLVTMIWEVEISTEFQGALTIILVFVSGWATRPRSPGRRAKV